MQRRTRVYSPNENLVGCSFLVIITGPTQHVATKPSYFLPVMRIVILFCIMPCDLDVPQRERGYKVKGESKVIEKEQIGRDNIYC